MKISSKVFWGAILILIGLTFFLQTTGLLLYLNLTAWEFIFWFLWPLLLVALGVKLLLGRNITAGVVFVALGIIFFLTKLFDWNFFAIFWPVLIIAVGLSIIFKQDDTHFNSGKKYDDSDKLTDTVVFWGLDKNMDSKSFKGGEVNAVFGGAKIDLRNAQIDKDGAKLVLNAAFGGIDVFVPKDCNVETDGIGILGGWENHTKSRDVKSPVLEISGSAVFGGVEIKE